MFSGCLIKMVPDNKATLHLWHPLTQCYKKGNPLIKNTTSQKIAPNINSTSQKCHHAKMAPRLNRLKSRFRWFKNVNIKHFADMLNF